MLVLVKRAVVGVVVVVMEMEMAGGAAGSVVRRRLGVVAETGMERPRMAVERAVDREGVRPRRSKMPSTRPSRWGVGLMEVGTAAAGVKRVRFRAGVFMAVAAPGVYASEGMGPVGKYCVFRGVWAGLDRFEGVCGATMAASDWVRLRCWLPSAASAGPAGGGGILPASMSRSLLYCLYFRAVTQDAS